MDKYEYKLKAEEIVRLAGKKQYKAAAKIADEIRWEKVKNIQMLCTVGDIYEKLGRFEESAEVFLQAYNRSPNGKMIVYRLVELYIELKDYQEAMAYYHEYMQLAPNDTSALTLKYRLYKARGARLETQIAILEEFKSKDYQEEWILELARLYHQAGQGEKCVELCDEIDLWFSSGPTVLRALELKRLYAPLTVLQEQKLSGYAEPEPEPVVSQSAQQYTQEMPSQQYTQEIPVQQYTQEVPVQQYTQEMPVQQYTQEIPSQQYTQEIPSQQYTQEVPSQQYTQEVPVQQYTQEVPVQQYTQEVPVQQYTQEVPAQQYTQETPVRQSETVPVMKASEPENVLTSVESVADAIIRMARPEKPKENQPLQKGFSILPKGNVVKANTDEFAFELPNGVEKTEIQLDVKPKEDKEVAKEATVEGNEAKEVQTVEAEETDEMQLLAEELAELSEEESEEQEKAKEEKPVSLFEKVMSRLTMEDDELDEDFNDDYDDSDDFLEKEEEMVTRGLTGQYEKVIIDDDDDDDDPLNTTMTSPFPKIDADNENEEGEEYEYIYDEDDEYGEYESIDEEEEYDSESADAEEYADDDVEYEDEYEDAEEEYEDEYADGEKEYEDEYADGEEEYADEYEDAEEEYADEYTDGEDEYVGNGYADDVYSEPVIPLSYATKYDTLNLQKELAKSIQQLMEATEKETVDSTLENVKKMVEASNIPELTETMRFKAVRGNMLNSVAKRQAEKLQQAMDIEEVVTRNAENVDEEPDIPAEDATVSMADARPKPAVELAIKLKPTTEEEDEPLENMLTQEDDGQLSLFMPKEEMVEKQITGQLNIEDVLKEWEKQELLSENDKEKRALEEARKRALEETQGIMNEIMGLLKDVIPKIGSIKDGEEKMSVLAESLERVQKSLPFTQGIVDAAEESKAAASAIEAACAEAVMELEKIEHQQPAEEKTELSANEEAAEEKTELSANEEAAEEKTESSANEEAAEEKTELSTNEEAAEEDAESSKKEQPNHEEYLKEQMALHDMYAKLLEEQTTAYEEAAAMEEESQPASVLEGEPAVVEETASSVEGEPAAVEEAASSLESEAEAGKEAAGQEIPAEEVSQSQDGEEEVSEELVPDFEQPMEDVVARMAEEVSQEVAEEAVELNEEQKNIMAYFLSIDSVKSQLKHFVKRTEYAPEHMIITGDKGSGKTSLAMRIIKAAQVNKEEKIETIAKIKAELLNQKVVREILEKVNGGVLIIENAGTLKPTTVYAIEEALCSNEYYVQIILTDKKEAVEKLLGTTRSFFNDIQMRVDLPVYTNNELAEFAKTYAQVNGYSFDGMAVLALHSVIEFFQADNHVTNLEDMKNIMDEAMEHADRRNKKLFGKLFGKKSADGTVLIESDFD